MANKKKKKPGKPKKPRQGDRHYCRVCGEHKANEKFSGRGHAAHICKACAKKSPAEKSEDMTINRLHGMTFRYLSESEMKWLKNRRSDNRPEVRELARQVFEEKFPRQARNEIKQKLHIKMMVFRVRGEIMDGYGDEYVVNVEYAADTSGKIIRKEFDDGGVFPEEKSVDIGVKAMRKLFNVAVHNYDISFWDTDLCGGDNSLDDYDGDEYESDVFDDEDEDGGDAEQFEADETETPDDREPSWSVEIKYKNGTEQNTKGYDYLPDPVIELYDDFESYFAEDGFDENDTDDAEDDINGGGDE